MAQVLIVDDDIGYLAALSEGLGVMQHEVTTASTASEAMSLLKELSFDVAIFDVIMQGGGAISLLHQVREINLDLPVIVVTGRPQIANSPVFREGMREATAKIEKTATLAQIDQLIRSVLKNNG